MKYIIPIHLWFDQWLKRLEKEEKENERLKAENDVLKGEAERLTSENKYLGNNIRTFMEENKSLRAQLEKAEGRVERIIRWCNNNEQSFSRGILAFSERIKEIASE